MSSSRFAFWVSYPPLHSYRQWRIYDIKIRASKDSFKVSSPHPFLQSDLTLGNPFQRYMSPVLKHYFLVLFIFLHNIQSSNNSRNLTKWLISMGKKESNQRKGSLYT